jgi:hypothetical protein
MHTVSRRLLRRILEDNPRVTRFQNRFDEPEEEHPADVGPVEEADDDLVIGEEFASGDNLEEDNSHGNRDDDKDGKDGDEIDRKIDDDP